MGLPSEVREEIIEIIEELYIMGFTKRSEVWRYLQKIGKTIDVRTVDTYLFIVTRRIRNRYKKIDLDKTLKKEIRDLDYMQKKMWLVYNSASTSAERTGVINSILKIKERRAKLLGLDTENINKGTAKTLEDLIAENEKSNIDKKNQQGNN